MLFKDLKYRNLFILNERGTLVMKNKEFMYNLCKKLFSNSFKLMLSGFQVPIYAFLPKSFLQLHAEFMQSIIPNLYEIIDLEKNQDISYSNKDILILNKLTNLLIVSQAYKCEYSKPFNPIWGETYSCIYDDGTEGYWEQISHHPAILGF